MTTLLEVLAALAAICALSVGLTVAVVWAIARRIRRSRAINDGLLRVRLGVSIGPRRTVLALRLHLRRSLDSGRSALRSMSRGGEIPRLFHRIEVEASALDARLRLLESEPDSRAVAAAIPGLERDTARVAAMIRTLRASIASEFDDPAGVALVDLQSDIEREVAALTAGADALRTLHQRWPEERSSR